ncbi:MAG: BatA domain-containing protein, partial [Candidatus Neomarinimicrobiota bacterium]|nr:BatA domain-containing protein [Candidatus Neomarinimicrobiota bacterium]
MISFLFPSILWGLFASLIPLVIHLASKRNLQVVEFSSIIHLKSLETESIKKLKIIEWLLVFIRMLVIVFLILTFAGPIQKSSTTWIASSKESTAVIIIDNSASLDVNKNNKSLLDKNLSLLPDILSSFDGSTSLKVFQTNPPKMIFNDFVEEGLKLNLENLNVSQSMGYDNLWVFTDSVLKSVESGLPNQECFILSDIQTLPPSTFDEDYENWQF